MVEPLVGLQQVTRSFVASRTLTGRQRTRVHAVRETSLSIEPASTYGLVGESGSGKSTLGRLSLRLVEPDSGDVYFSGERFTAMSGTRLRATRRQMSMVFQDPRSSLDPTWTVGRSVTEPLLAGADRLAAGERWARGEAALESVGLHRGMMGRHPSEFSGGQRQRISIARAVVTNPSYIVCDEPVSGLDVSSRAHVMTLLRDLQHHRGLTYLFISHDLSVVRAMSDRIGVMYLGSLVESGPTAEVAGSPAHPYTEVLLSAVPDASRAMRGRTVNSEHRNRIALGGDPPSPFSPPSGCAFHPRCPHAMPICSEVAPEPVEIAPGRTAACHLHTVHASPEGHPSPERHPSPNPEGDHHAIRQVLH